MTGSSGTKLQTVLMCLLRSN